MITPIVEEAAITFSDISLVPAFSDIESRSECNVESKFTRNFDLMIPIIAANMSSICEEEMAIELMNLGGVGIVHRFNSIGEQCDMVKEVVQYAQNLMDSKNSIWGIKNIPICFAIGATGDYFERAQELLKNGVNVLCIDIAHGHSIGMKRAIEKLQQLKSVYKFDIIAGNIATRQAAIDLIAWGANCLKCGVSSGALCKTRIETGMGIPSLSALSDVVSGAFDKMGEVPIILDGGITSGGDLAKGLIFNANSAMCGSLFAATSETPGKTMEVINSDGSIKIVKAYYGSASAYQKKLSNIKIDHIEGEYTLVDYKGPVRDIINSLLDGLRSSMSYAGARNLIEFRNTQYVRVTQAGIIEGHPHLLFKK